MCLTSCCCIVVSGYCGHSNVSFTVDELKTNGFCTATPDTTQYYSYIDCTRAAIALFLMGIQIVYSILAILHVKRNPSQEDIEEKKAVAKLLGYSWHRCFNSVLLYQHWLLNCSAANSNETTTAVDYILLLDVNWFCNLYAPILMILLLQTSSRQCNSYSSKISAASNDKLITD